MEGILALICLRRSFFHGHRIVINADAHGALRTVTSQSYFKSKNRKHFDDDCCCNCSELYCVFFILFNFCLALLHKYCGKILGACCKVHNFNKFRLGFLEGICRLRLFGEVFLQSIIWQSLELRKNLATGLNRSFRSLGTG